MLIYKIWLFYICYIMVSNKNEGNSWDGWGVQQHLSRFPDAWLIDLVSY